MKKKNKIKKQNRNEKPTGKESIPLSLDVNKKTPNASQATKPKIKSTHHKNKTESKKNRISHPVQTKSIDSICSPTDNHPPINTISTFMNRKKKDNDEILDIASDESWEKDEWDNKLEVLLELINNGCNPSDFNKSLLENEEELSQLKEKLIHDTSNKLKNTAVKDSEENMKDSCQALFEKNSCQNYFHQKQGKSCIKEECRNNTKHKEQKSENNENGDVKDNNRVKKNVNNQDPKKKSSFSAASTLSHLENLSTDTNASTMFAPAAEPFSNSTQNHPFNIPPNFQFTFKPPPEITNERKKNHTSEEEADKTLLTTSSIPQPPPHPPLPQKPESNNVNFVQATSSSTTKNKKTTLEKSTLNSMPKEITPEEINSLFEIITDCLRKSDKSDKKDDDKEAKHVNSSSTSSVPKKKHNKNKIKFHDFSNLPTLIPHDTGSSFSSKIENGDTNKKNTNRKLTKTIITTKEKSLETNNQIQKENIPHSFSKNTDNNSAIDDTDSLKRNKLILPVFGRPGIKGYFQRKEKVISGTKKGDYICFACEYEHFYTTCPLWGFKKKKKETQTPVDT